MKDRPVTAIFVETAIYMLGALIFVGFLAVTNVGLQLIFDVDWVFALGIQGACMFAIEAARSFHT